MRCFFHEVTIDQIWEGNEEEIWIAQRKVKLKEMSSF